MEAPSGPKKENVESMTSDRRGLAGFIETLLRRFKQAFHLVALVPIYALMAAIFGACLVPGIYVFLRWEPILVGLTDSSLAQNFFRGFLLASGYLLYGFTGVFLIPLMNFILRLKLTEWRGPYYSLPAIRWYMHNGLTYMLRFTFLEFVTPTPFNLLFYRLMGMRLGRGVTINSSWISDPSLISMGDKVTVGGSATIIGHYGQGGYLVLKPVLIGNNVTLGLRCTVMGGVEIGDNAKILPHSVILPKTKIPANETWGGIPAQRIQLHQLSQSHHS